MMRKLYLTDTPEKIADSAFVAPNATVVGDVAIGEGSSIWYGAVIRGDTEPVTIGSETSIQDTCVLHADPGTPCQIGDRVTVGHAAIVHGAVVESDVLIGMRAVILNGARIGTGSVIAAGAIVKENEVIPPSSLVMGIPAKVRGEVNDAHRQMIAEGAKHYVEAGQAYKQKLKRTS